MSEWQLWHDIKKNRIVTYNQLKNMLYIIVSINAKKMSIPTLISLIIISCFLLLNCTKIENSIDNADIAKRKYYKDSLTIALETFSKKSLIPGFSIAIVNEKGELYSEGFGYSDIKNKTAFNSQTINWVASISKTLVGLSIMKLVEQKKLDLDEPINSILPYKIINPYFPNKQITVRHLVTHTSTLIDSFEPYTVGEADICLEEDGNYDNLPAYLQPNITWFRLGKKISLDDNIRKFTQPKEKWYSDSSFLQKEPGSYFQYSNLGASIAARIVELRSNMSFIEFTKEYIFDPLKMSNTAWNFKDLDPKLISKIYVPNEEKKSTAVVEHPQYYMTNYPVSGLKTNANDLAKYLIEMINGFDGKGKLLNNDSYKMLFTPQLSCENLQKSDSSIFNDKFNSAILWSVTATGYRLHFGGNTGVYSFIYFNPKTKSGALAICNLRDKSFGDIIEIVNKYEQGYYKK